MRKINEQEREWLFKHEDLINEGKFDEVINDWTFEELEDGIWNIFAIMMDVFPNFLELIKTIPTCAFCEETIKDLTIPSNITKIEPSAFCSCKINNLIIESGMLLVDYECDYGPFEQSRINNLVLKDGCELMGPIHSANAASCFPFWNVLIINLTITKRHREELEDMIEYFDYGLELSDYISGKLSVV